MSGRIRPSARKKTLHNVMHSNLSITDKGCIDEVFAKFEQLKADKEALIAGQETLQRALTEKNAEIERLKEYEDIRPAGCPNCHRGNFSNSKFCSHCGTQLQGKKKDVRAKAIKEFVKTLKEHLCSYDLDDYHSFRAIEEETLDNLFLDFTKMVGGD